MSFEGGRRLKNVFCVMMAGLMLLGCGDGDRLAEINKLQAAGEVREAIQVYREWVESSKNPNVEREYLKFLFENKQYLDFSKDVRSYVARFPQDGEIMELQFEYYARLARDAERTEQYETAIDYIVSYLLSPDYSDYRKWESRQTTILRKWLQEAIDEGDVTEQKNVVAKMMVMNFGNLAESVAPEIYQELASQVSTEEEVSPAN